MAVRLHRAAALPDRPSGPARTSAPARFSLVGGTPDPAPAQAAGGDAPTAPAPSATPRAGAPRPSFPPPPTIKLSPPVPIGRAVPRHRLLVPGAVALALLLGAVLLALVVHAFVSRGARLEGVVLDTSHPVAAPHAGVFHPVVARGASVKPGAVIARIVLPEPTPPEVPATEEGRRLEESVRRAEASLAAAQRHEAEVARAFREDRASRSEWDDAQRDVRFRLAERERLSQAFAAATAPAPAAAPAAIPVTADGGLVVARFLAADGAEVRAATPIAIVVPRESTVEAPLGKQSAPDEGTTLTARIGGRDVPARITGLHVEGATRTITVVFAAPDGPPPPGTKITLRF